MVIVADAPGERAVSHAFTASDVDELIASIAPYGTGDDGADTPFLDAPPQAGETPE